MNPTKTQQVELLQPVVQTKPASPTTGTNIGDFARVVKYASLITLCAQNTASYLLMGYVRSRSQNLFAISTAVVVSEVIKVAACFVIISVEKRSLSKMASHVYDNTVGNPRDCLKICVPSLLYVAQNNLLYIALSHLDAVTFQVLYQFKILTTAIFSVLLLKKRLTRTQWLALIMLFIGVTVVQINIANNRHTRAVESSLHRPVVGMVAAAAGSLISGFTGVFLEKILKDTQPSIFIRNIQMGSLGVVIAIVGVCFTDMESVRLRGFFAGYDSMVWIVVCLHSVGGLVTATVMKYADNILKGYAFALSILSSCVISYYFLNFHIDVGFVMGTAAVVLSVFLYSKKRPSLAQTVPQTHTPHP